MDTPWIIGIAGAVLFFAFFEIRALRNPQEQDTLSSFLVKIGSRWPITIFLMGLLVGALAVHLFANWCH